MIDEVGQLWEPRVVNKKLLVNFDTHRQLLDSSEPTKVERRVPRWLCLLAWRYRRTHCGGVCQVISANADDARELSHKRVFRFLVDVFHLRYGSHFCRRSLGQIAQKDDFLTLHINSLGDQALSQPKSSFTALPRQIVSCASAFARSAHSQFPLLPLQRSAFVASHVCACILNYFELLPQ